MQDHDSGIVVGTPVFAKQPDVTDPQDILEMENQQKSKAFIDGLTALKLVADKNRWSFLKKHVEWLASLSQEFFDSLVAGCQNNKLVTSDELEKARALGKKEIPEYLAKNPVFTLDWWKKLKEKKPADAAKLEDPNRLIPVKIKNTLTTIKVEALGNLSIKETKRIIMPNHPEVGLLNPNNDRPTFFHTDRPKTYYPVTDMKLLNQDSVLEITLKNTVCTFNGRFVLIPGSIEQKKLFKSILEFLG